MNLQVLLNYLFHYDSLLYFSTSCFPPSPGHFGAASATVHPKPGIQEQGRDVLHAPRSGGLPAGEGRGGAREAGQGEGGRRHGVHSKILLWDAVQLRGERTHLSPPSQNIYIYIYTHTPKVHTVHTCFAHERKVTLCPLHLSCVDQFVWSVHTHIHTNIYIPASWIVPAKRALPVSHRLSVEMFLEL